VNGGTPPQWYAPGGAVDCEVAHGNDAIADKIFLCMDSPFLKFSGPGPNPCHAYQGPDAGVSDQ
jgi:hypothetical protein